VRITDYEEFTKIPSGLSEAFDMIHEALGCFEPTEAEGDEWWKTKRRYMGIIKRVCAKRAVTMRHVGIALWFARHPENEDPPKTLFDLLGTVPLAMRAYNKELVARTKQKRQLSLDEAVEEALALGEQEWAERMIRAGAVPLEWTERMKR
jgi:hypothetical protein